MDDTDLAISLDNFIVMSCGSVLLCNKIKKKPRKRRWWMVLLNKSRKVYSATSLTTGLVKEPFANILIIYFQTETNDSLEKYQVEKSDSSKCAPCHNLWISCNRRQFKSLYF
nr:unnamed protein product [Callosobruchus chinensis]